MQVAHEVPILVPMLAAACAAGGLLLLVYRQVRMVHGA